MTENEKASLRADVAAYMQSTQQAPEPLPLPAAANRAALNPAQQEALFENWVEHIYAKPTQTWQPDEVAAIKVAAQRALRTL